MFSDEAPDLLLPALPPPPPPLTSVHPRMYLFSLTRREVAVEPQDAVLARLLPDIHASFCFHHH